MTTNQHESADRLRRDIGDLESMIAKVDVAIKGFNLKNTAAQTQVRVQIFSDTSCSFDMEDSVMSRVDILRQYREGLSSNLKKCRDLYSKI